MSRARSHENPPIGGANHQQSNSAALSLWEVVKLTGLSRAYVYELMARGQFPRPAKIGRRSIWSRQEVLAWLESRFAERPVLHRDERGPTSRRGG